MPRTAAERTAAYTAKMDPEIIGERFTARAATMKSNFGRTTALLQDCVRAVKVFLSSLDDPSIGTQVVGAWIACALRCDKASRMHPGTMGQNEIRRIETLFVARGLDDTDLKAFLGGRFGFTL
jgi:hypothetical protein